MLQQQDQQHFCGQEQGKIIVKSIMSVVKGEQPEAKAFQAMRTWMRARDALVALCNGIQKGRRKKREDRLRLFLAPSTSASPGGRKLKWVGCLSCEREQRHELSPHVSITGIKKEVR